MRCLCLLVCIAAALPGQPALSLAEAVAEALRSHPALAAVSQRVAAADGLRVQSGIRPNPRIYLQTENLRLHGSPGFNFPRDADTFAYVSQLIETGGKRDRRVEVAEANARRAELERELLSRRIARDVKLAYWNATATEKVRELLRENAGNFAQIVEYHEARAREGALAEVDLIRVRLEGQRLELAANSAELEAERARIQLFREMGRSQFPVVRFSEPLERLDVALEPAAPDERTELKIARLQLERARANVALQRASARPDIEFLGGYKRATGFNTLIGGVQINLPFSDRNQGNIAAAEWEVRAAEADLAATEAVIQAEVAAARREYEIRRRQVVESLAPLRRNALEASRIMLAAYREGGGDLLRLLDAERARIEVEILYYRTLADYQQSKVALEAALGAQP